MTGDRRAALVAGTLFIVADAAGIPSLALWAPIVSAPDYLVRISANENQVVTSALLQFIMAAACAGIGVALYPVLRRYSEGLALGSVAFRLIEAVLEIAAALGVLVLLSVSRQFVSGGMADAATYAALGGMLIASREWVVNVAVQLAWGLGALMYYYVLYRAQLVPRWLAGWGLVAIFGPLVAATLVMFGLISAQGTAQLMLNLPVALQEVALGLWLILRGFNPSAPPAEPWAVEVAADGRTSEALLGIGSAQV